MPKSAIAYCFSSISIIVKKYLLQKFIPIHIGLLRIVVLHESHWTTNFHQLWEESFLFIDPLHVMVSIIKFFACCMGDLYYWNFIDWIIFCAKLIWTSNIFIAKVFPWGWLLLFIFLMRYATDRCDSIQAKCAKQHRRHVSCSYSQSCLLNR